MSELSLDDVRTAVEAVLRDVPEVAVAYAYGSRVSGRPLPMSDLDLAFVLEDDARPEDPLFAEGLAAGIASELGTSVEIDAHLVADLPLPVLGRIVTRGVLIFQRNPERQVEFETSTRRLYFEFLPFLERDARIVLGSRG